MDLTEIGNLTAASEKVSGKMERGVFTGLDEQSCFFNTAPEHELVEKWIERRCGRHGFKPWPSQMSSVINGFVKAHTVLHSMHWYQNWVGRLLVG
jgi:hypothetical protein